MVNAAASSFPVPVSRELATMIYTIPIPTRMKHVLSHALAPLPPLFHLKDRQARPRNLGFTVDSEPTAGNFFTIAVISMQVREVFISAPLGSALRSGWNFGSSTQIKSSLLEERESYCRSYRLPDTLSIRDNPPPEHRRYGIRCINLGKGLGPIARS